MNWLAHAYLSEPDIHFRLGNVLADLVSPTELSGMCEPFRRGVNLHRRIDAFTDTHPTVLRSRSRLQGEQRRFAGIIIDVYYDHLLALDWEQHSPELLESFAHDFYKEAQAQQASLPSEARWVLERMIQEDRLTSYRDVEGVYSALKRLSERISVRLGRSVALESAVPQLLDESHVLARDFDEFFPSLKRHVESLPQGDIGA